MEVFEKIKEKIQNQPIEQFVGTYGDFELVREILDSCCEAVDQVAEEYSAWKDIYAKALALEGSYAKSGDMESVNYCIRLENLLQYFKEELTSDTDKFATDTNVGDNGWIPCSERLPEESLNSVIGWDEYRNRCCFVQYYGGRWILGNDIDSVKIIAWQPIPEPYQPKNQSEKPTTWKDAMLNTFLGGKV